MAQKVTGYIKLQIEAGKATPAPPVGPALGQKGVNIMAFTKEFNERTSGSRSDQEGRWHQHRFRQAQQGKGCYSDRRSGGRDRQDQDARPERRFSGSCMQHGPWHLPLHGRYRRGLRHKQWEGITLPA